MGEQAPATDSLVARHARAAARRLSAEHTEHGQDLIVAVEGALRPGDRANQYSDPIALGSLIVATAGLGWSIYQDLRSKKAKPTRELLAQRIRVELPADSAVTPTQRDQVIEVVIDQIIDDADT